jgi:hypothetical protein
MNYEIGLCSIDEKSSELLGNADGEDFNAACCQWFQDSGPNGSELRVIDGEIYFKHVHGTHFQKLLDFSRK